MVDRHCPFLNREDPRCAAHLQVNHLQHAFEHCAGEYAACPSYRELLAERIMRRAAESRDVDGSRVSLRVGGQPYADSRRFNLPTPVTLPITLTVAARRWSFTERGLVDVGGGQLAAR